MGQIRNRESSTDYASATSKMPLVPQMEFTFFSFENLAENGGQISEERFQIITLTAVQFKAGHFLSHSSSMVHPKLKEDSS